MAGVVHIKVIIAAPDSGTYEENMEVYAAYNNIATKRLFMWKRR